MTQRPWFVLAAAMVASVSLHAQGPPAPASLPSGANLLVGRVTDAETGSPVASAVVALTVAGASGPASAERVLTDASGRFFFSSIGPGAFTLTAMKPGWIEGAGGRTRPEGPSRPVNVRDGQVGPEISIRLWRYGVVSGRVVDEQGEPLVATEVRIFQGSFAAGRRQWSFTERAITDDRGVYRFSRLVPGSYLVVVPAATTSEPDSLRGPTPVPLSYYQTMSPIGAAPMTLEAATMPVPGGSLVTSILQLSRPPSGGEAWLGYPTTYFPSTSAIGTAAIVEVVSGRERANADVTMRLVPTYRVSGTLTLPEGLAPGFHAVHLVPADSSNNPLFDVATALTDAAGVFTFIGVPAGQYIARVVRTPPPGDGMRFGTCGGTGAISFICTIFERPMSGPPLASADPLLSADEPVAVVDRDVGGVALAPRPGPRLSGRAELAVTTSLTPEQWRGIKLVLDPAGGQVFKAAGGFEVNSPGHIAEDGRVVLPSTRPGRYVLRVAGLPPGWTVARATLQGDDVLDTAFDLHGDRSDLILTLTNQVTEISGTVRGSDGRPDDEVAILMFPADQGGWTDYGRSDRRLRLVPVSAGSFSTPAPPEGDYLLVALSDRQLAEWRNPEFLKRAAVLADRVRVRDGQSTAIALRTRSLP